jgi:hypothetical protein
MPRKHRTDRVALARALLTVWCAGCLALNAPATSTPSPAFTLTPPASAAYTVPPATATLPLSPAPPPSPTATSAPQLEIGRLGSNADEDGCTQLAGEIHYISATPVTAIKLRLELSGHAPIDFAPQLDVIGAGQSAPFDLI